MKNNDDTDDKDIEISNPEILNNFAKNLFHQANLEPKFEPSAIAVSILNKEDFYIILDDDRRFEVEEITIYYQYISEKSLSILNLFKYTDEIENLEKVQLGRAILNMDGRRGSLIIKRSKDHIELSFHPEEL